MAHQHYITIADQRQVTSQLYWLTLHAPDLARHVRPGHYVLVRCAEQGSYDPLLRRPLFVAAVEQAVGQIGLLYTSSERGLAWLARGKAGDTLDVVGLCGRPLTLSQQTRSVLLIGQGERYAPLILLAHQAVAQGSAVTLLLGMPDADALPPAFLLPMDVEYQHVVGNVTELLVAEKPSPQDQALSKKANRKQRKQREPLLSELRAPLIAWADQVCVAAPPDQLQLVAQLIRNTRLRWDRGFASVIVDAPLVCGVGACSVCATETRQGVRMVCADGPILDLRDIEVG
ncbi:MAG: hypothetical protein AAGF95_10455 [Chloroflexota bacterium]